MIVVGDLHLKKSEAYFSAQVKFLKWLDDNYKDEVLVLLGDVFDSTPHFDIYSEFKSFLKYRKNRTLILNGNHDGNYRIGEYLKGIHLMDNVDVLFEETVVDIEGYNCLMLPHKKDMNNYSTIKGDYDFIFGHFVIKQEAFGNEYVDISALNYKKMILGHIHLKRQYGYIIIQGVPLPTRNLETSNPILQIGKNFEITEIPVPEFLKIETINYDNDKKTLNKEFIYNIVDAPSVKSVYEKFKEYYIRHEGIQLKQDTVDSDVKFDFDSNNLMKYFKQFIDENKVNKEYSDIIAGYLVR